MIENREETPALSSLNAKGKSPVRSTKEKEKLNQSPIGIKWSAVTLPCFTISSELLA